MSKKSSNFDSDYPKLEYVKKEDNVPGKSKVLKLTDSSNQHKSRTNVALQNFLHPGLMQSESESQTFNRPEEVVMFKRSAIQTTFAAVDEGRVKHMSPGYDYEADRHRLCGKPLICGHVCGDPAVWNEFPCGMCRRVIQYPRACGHSVTIYCGRQTPILPCSKPCNKTLVCGHPCNMDCGNPLCGKGTCGSMSCKKLFPHEQAKFLALRGPLPKEEDMGSWSS